MRKLAVAALMSVSTLFNVYAQGTKYGIQCAKPCDDNLRTRGTTRR